MKRSLLSLFLSLIAVVGWAVTFEPTTVTGSSFAASTKWYTMLLGNGGLYISDNGANTYIELATSSIERKAGDADSWCFVGNATDGYLIYNKAQGTTKVLSAPSDRSANTGGNANVVLKAIGAAGYDQRWNIIADTRTNAANRDALIAVKGYDSHLLNNRLGKLAFWTTGADQGSAIQIKEVEAYNAAWAGLPTNKQYLFKTRPGQLPYRIPALVQAKNGNLVAVTDHRPGGNDIGFGEVDIKARVSKDNGATWGEEFFIADGTGTPKAADCGYGDAAIVADSESNEILMICVNGNTVWWDGDYLAGNPQPVSLFRSYDGGETWTGPQNITEQVYSPFRQSKYPAVKSLFFGSGRMVQSTRIKVGSHYRIYGAVCARDNGNRVFYSDDFGKTWNVLGGIDALPAPQGNEPKVEELPNGDVVLSTRNNGAGNNRVFNIYKYTRQSTGEGAWGNQVLSTGPDGIIAQTNNTNGEILIVPARRVSDDSRVFVALQSVPFGPGRANVGIYYKPLIEGTYETSEKFAQKWEGSFPVSTMYSAYSTMILQQDNKIGFFYEEETFGAAYTEVYVKYTLEEITGNKYKIDSTFQALPEEMAGFQKEIDLISKPSNFLGSILPEARAQINEAFEAYKANLGNSDYRDALVKVFNNSRLQAEDSTIYRIYNVATGKALAPVDGTRLSGDATDATAAEQQEWVFYYVPAAKAFRIVSAGTPSYLRGPESREGNLVNRQDASTGAGYFQIVSNTDGTSRIRTFLASHKVPFLGLNAEGKLVSSAIANDNSLWRIEKIRKQNEAPTAINNVKNNSELSKRYVDLSGRRASAKAKGIKINQTGKKTF